MKAWKCSCHIRILLTAFLSLCFAAHMQKELFKFFQAKTTTSTSVIESMSIQMPAMAICAKQVLNTSYPGHIYWVNQPRSHVTNDWTWTNGGNPETIWSSRNQSVAKLADMLDVISFRKDVNHPREVIYPDLLNNTSIIEIDPIETALNGRCFLLKFKTELLKSSTAGLVFPKKFGDLWDSEVYLFTPGNEVGLIAQFWPNPVHHINLPINRETDVLLSVRVDISKKKTCQPDSTFIDFVDCFKAKIRNFFLSNDSLKICPDCQNLNISVCAIVPMKFFLEPGVDLKFCSTSESLKCSTECFYDKMRFLLDESPLGCQRPCMTTSYQIAKHEFPGFNFSEVGDKVSSFYMGVDSTDIEIREDYILFDAADFFTAVGGSLGLFLGFSFLDVLLFICVQISRKFNS